MPCPCGRSPDSCRGWHALSDEQYRKELKAYKAEKNKNSFFGICFQMRENKAQHGVKTVSLLPSLSLSSSLLSNGNN